MRTVRRIAPPIPSRFHTLADLRARTGLPARVLQSWVDSGAIIAEGELHGGRGLHRQYRTAEVIVAVLLTPLAQMGFPIGVMVRLGGIVRQALGIGPGMAIGTEGPARGLVEPGAFQIRVALQRAVLGQGRNYLFLSYNTALIVGVPHTAEAEKPIAFDPYEVEAEFLSGAPRSGFWIDLAVLQGLWEEVEEGEPTP